MRSSGATATALETVESKTKSGIWLLVAGCWLLVAGCWFFVWAPRTALTGPLPREVANNQRPATRVANAKENAPPEHCVQTRRPPPKTKAQLVPTSSNLLHQLVLSTPERGTRAALSSPRPVARSRASRFDPR